MKIPTVDEVNRRRPIGALLKKPIAQPVVRKLKARQLKIAEDSQKARVRRRDGYCRFPLCGCRKFALRLEVSHAQHKGAGGNPKGDRSEPRKMILLCVARHQANGVAVDRGTIRIRPLRPREGLGGPCAFDVDVRAAGYMALRSDRPRWLEVARETARHVFEPFTPEQQQLLAQLAEMQL